MTKFRRNGDYIIDEVHINRLSDRWEGYVLAKHAAREAYVTWYFLVRDGEWDYNHGHYFDTYPEALRDFHLRIAGIYE